MNFWPKLVHRFVVNSHIRSRLIANKDLIIKCNSHQMNRLFCSVEENTENVKKDSLSERDRSLVVTPQQSIRYLKSDAYKETYGHHKVWHLFRRNFKGQFSPLRSRGNCIVEGMVWTSNPCPICRDQYLVLDYTNLDLINQFINPQTGYVYENTVLSLCSEQYLKLLVAVNLAKNYGLITFELPLRTYRYEEYYKNYRPEICRHKH